MPLQTQQIPWYFIAAQWGQIITYIALPVFIVVQLVFAGLIFAKVNGIAKRLAGDVTDASAETATEAEETGNGGEEDPDISEFVE